MDHFTLGDWVDFIRKLKSGSVAVEMQTHLDQGCQRCLKVVRMWEHLSAFASHGRLFCPPDHALRSVRGYYRVLRPKKRGSRTAVMARLLFDSFFEAVPAGIRSSQSAPRQLVYAAGRLVIDLRIEHRSGHAHIVGQAQPRSPGERNSEGREVMILREGETVARTTSNQFGEFQFDLQSEDNDEFSIVLKGLLSFVVPVRSVGQGGPAES
jgi:hypothetical protein